MLLIYTLHLLTKKHPKNPNKIY